MVSFSTSSSLPFLHLPLLSRLFVLSSCNLEEDKLTQNRTHPNVLKIRLVCFYY